jgi:hypothetical protein
MGDYCAAGQPVRRSRSRPAGTAASQLARPTVASYRGGALRRTAAPRCWLRLRLPLQPRRYQSLTITQRFGLQSPSWHFSPLV